MSSDRPPLEYYSFGILFMQKRIFAHFCIDLCIFMQFLFGAFIHSAFRGAKKRNPHGIPLFRRFMEIVV